MMLTDLADVCRTSGLTVVEHSGWKTRGHGQMSDVRTITCHHTANGGARGDAPSLNVVMNGRPGLDGPLSQILLSRASVVHIIAAGLCYHAGVSRDVDYTNAHAIGIEAEATGVGPWDGPDLQNYGILAGVLAEHYGAKVLGHKETCSPPGRKSDPSVPMSMIRDYARDAVMPLTQKDVNAVRDAVLGTRFARNLNGPDNDSLLVDMQTFAERTDAKLDALTDAVRALSQKP